MDVVLLIIISILLCNHQLWEGLGCDVILQEVVLRGQGRARQSPCEFLKLQWGLRAYVFVLLKVYMNFPLYMILFSRFKMILLLY